MRDGCYDVFVLPVSVVDIITFTCDTCMNMPSTVILIILTPSTTLVLNGLVLGSYDMAAMKPLHERISSLCTSLLAMNFSRIIDSGAFRFCRLIMS